MSRCILRFAFFAVLFAFATSARAQNNCSEPVQSPYTIVSQTPPGAMPCSGNQNVTFTVLISQTDYCENTNNYTDYVTQTRQTFGLGLALCTINPLSPNVRCDPRFDYEATTATSPTDYNRFYLRAYDGYGGAWGPCKNDIFSRQDFWQCSGRPCPTGRCGGKDGPPCGSPIILDLNGKGFALTDAAHGVKFDISGTGSPVQMGWTAPGADNAFLCLPDSDGKCDDGKDLFGNFTPQPHSDNPNGFAALAVYDDPKNGGNGDGVIDARDAIFSSLRLWIDANHDGVSQPEELHTLPSLGVNSISLTYKLSEKEDQYGNRFRYRAEVNPDDPDAARVGRTAYDVFFVVLNPPGSTKNLLNPEGQKCAVPTSTKGGMLSTTGTLR
jgi:hypothetical protein